MLIRGKNKLKTLLSTFIYFIFLNSLSVNIYEAITKLNYHIFLLESCSFEK